MPEESRTLARVIRRARLDAGISQQKLAELAQVSIGTVKKIEAEASPEPGFFVIARVAQSLRGRVSDTRKFDQTLAQFLRD